MLHEKTLELNITHELLSLAEGISIVPRLPFDSIFRIPYRFRLNYATGVHINEENNRGGYDVALHSGSAKVFYIQLKKGEHTKFSVNPSSRFRGSRSNPSEHCLFKINNNSSNDQHASLQNLSNTHKGGVFYMLPFTTTERQLVRNVGFVSEHGLTLSIDQIDREASLNGVSIADGSEHKLRVPYVGGDVEIESEPTALSLKSEFDLIRDSITLLKLEKIEKVASENGLTDSSILSLKIFSMLQSVVIEAMYSHLKLGSDQSVKLGDEVLKKFISIQKESDISPMFRDFVNESILDKKRAGKILGLLDFKKESHESCFVSFDKKFIKNNLTLIRDGQVFEPNFTILW